MPDYLRDRPINIILHCLDWMARSHKLTASNIFDNDQKKGIFEIMKSSGAKYRIRIGNDNPDSILIHDTRVWSTGVEILATASPLHIPVFTLIPNVNTYKWFRYNPLHGDRLTFPSQDLPTKQLSLLNDIELLNVRGCAMTVLYHKMSLQPVFITTVFKNNIVCTHLFYSLCYRLICTSPLTFKVFLPLSSCVSNSFSHCKFALSSCSFLSLV